MTEPVDDDIWIPVRPRTIVAVLLMIDVMFLVLHLASQTLSDDPMSRHDLVNLDQEVSFPTWWHQAQLAGAGGICLIVGAVARRVGEATYRYWLVLGGILLYLSVDEGSEVHEGLIQPMQSTFDISSGLLVYAWVIPGAIAVAVFGLFFARFWWRLPRRPRLFIGVGGACYLAGALVVESLSGAHRSAHGIDRTYSLYVAGEEGLEMIGVSLFVFGVLCAAQLIQPLSGVAFRVEDA